MCNVSKRGSVLDRNFMRLFGDYDTALVDGCPLRGPFQMLNWEINKQLPAFLPSVIPVGDYMFLQHLHDASNHTFIQFKVWVFIKGRPGYDMSMLTMG